MSISRRRYSVRSSMCEVQHGGRSDGLTWIKRRALFSYGISRNRGSRSSRRYAAPAQSFDSLGQPVAERDAGPFDEPIGERGRDPGEDQGADQHCREDRDVQARQGGGGNRRIGRMRQYGQDEVVPKVEGVGHPAVPAWRESIEKREGARRAAPDDQADQQA